MAIPGHNQPVDPDNHHQASPNPRGRKKWPWVVGVVTALIIVAAIAGGQGGNRATTTGTAGTQVPASTSEMKPIVSATDPQTAPPTIQQTEPSAVEPAKPTTHHVKYTVTGAKRGSITYNVDGMTSIQQETNVQLPWVKEFDWPADEAFQMAQVLVQNSGSGQVTCTITVDDAVAKTVTSKGAYAIASCDASMGTLSH